MSRADQPIPCQVGLRCPDPENCTHTFRHPDQSLNRLHPDDWFEPIRAEYAPGAAGDAEYQAAVAAHTPVAARAQWACKLDCPQSVRTQCLAEGLTPGVTLQYGIRAGYTASERQKIVKDRDERAKQAKAAGGTDR
jgi:hypothetical protein